MLGVPVPFRLAFYAHLGLLHFSLLLRVVGDLGASLTLRQWGGLLNVAAVLLFLANIVFAVRHGQRVAAGTRRNDVRHVAAD